MKCSWINETMNRHLRRFGLILIIMGPTIMLYLHLQCIIYYHHLHFICPWHLTIIQESLKMFYACCDSCFRFINRQIKLWFIYESAQIWSVANGWCYLKLLAMPSVFFEMNKCKIFVWAFSEFHSYHPHFYIYLFQHCT